MFDEVLFYGGIIAAGVSCLGLFIAFLVSKIKETALNAQLTKEYGEPLFMHKGEKHNGKNHPFDI